jgi:hypothetical protein
MKTKAKEATYKIGDRVYHQRHGFGKIVAFWGRVAATDSDKSRPQNSNYIATCSDVVDVFFRKNGTLRLHSCRMTYLTPA